MREIENNTTEGDKIERKAAFIKNFGSIDVCGYSEKKERVKAKR